MHISPERSRLMGTALSGMIFVGSVIGYIAVGFAGDKTTVIQPPEMQRDIRIETAQVYNQESQEYTNEQIAEEPADAVPVVQKPQQAQSEQPVMQETQEAKEAPKTSDAPDTLEAQDASAALDMLDLRIATRAEQIEKDAETERISRGNGSDTSKIADLALSFVGTQYVSGGMSRDGFDCSGFVKYIYEGSGITIARTSYQQFESGVLVDKDELQLGDLVFFTTYASGASHVGIYIGGGNFVHASNPKDYVKITRMNDSYYAPRYLGARRYE